MGARSDEPYARILSERYEREGYVPYFYQDCKPLCLESTVGAFFVTQRLKRSDPVIKDIVVAKYMPSGRGLHWTFLATAICSRHSHDGRRRL